ncbi:MAG TPA: helix-turn-helix domain-containing protein, partial [Thermodesulfovibrionales bacterium]|nr:helix-turn-helix domain-containing protein [Thermodesulfovibrionales bacterium]
MVYSTERPELIGEILKNRREELGLELREVAHTLRIQYQYLKALEDNALGKLPPAVYTRGYIREYSRFLGVDPEPLIDEYAGHMEPKEDIPQEPLVAEKKFAFPRIILLLLLTIALVLAAVILSPTSKTPLREPAGEHTYSPAALSPQPPPPGGNSKVSPLPASEVSP